MLLREAGYDIDIKPADIDERLVQDETPRCYVSRLAASKAATVAAMVPGRVVIGADTIVLVDGVVFGKPVDRDDAAQMLRCLAGRFHSVLTGVAVMSDEMLLEGVEETRVKLSALDSERIGWYVGTGESDDKAGGYAVQGIGSRFIERLEGSYTNVVGLPISMVQNFLQRIGSDSPVSLIR